MTLIVLAYNHAAYVEQALDSARAQQVADLELIVCDDASRDGTPEAIRSWVERTGSDATLILREVNVGLPASVNAALARSHGEFVCMLAGDDYYDSDAVDQMLTAIRAQDDDVAVVYSDARLVARDGSTIHAAAMEVVIPGQVPPEGWVFAQIQRVCFLTPVAAMIRRSAVIEVGSFDESLDFEDWDMWLRLADRYRFVYLPGVVASHRVLPTSLYHASFGSPRFQRGVVTMMRRWLDRDEDARRTSAFWIRRAARAIAVEDRAEARRLLESVESVPRRADDPVPWHVVSILLRVPGTGRLLPRAESGRRFAERLWQAEHRAWVNGRRNPLSRLRSS